MVEREDRVKHHEPRVVVSRRRRVSHRPDRVQGRLEPARGVVPEEADGAAREAGQPGHDRRAVVAHQAPQTVHERHVFGGGDAVLLDQCQTVPGPQHQERVLPEEGVARHLFPALHAFEEKRVVGVLGHLEKRREWCQEVGANLLADRHERPA